MVYPAVCPMTHIDPRELGVRSQPTVASTCLIANLGATTTSPTYRIHSFIYPATGDLYDHCEIKTRGSLA